MGEDLLDLMLYEGNLDDVPAPSEGRSSPDPVLELFNMPVKCSSPTHSQLYTSIPQAPPSDTQAPPTNSLPEASLADLSTTNSLEWLLSEPAAQLDEVDQYYDQFWLNHLSPGNSSAVSSIPSPQQPATPPPTADSSVQPSPQLSVAGSCEQYGCLHDHTYAAMEPHNEEDKYLEKRRKNNLASQVSRAKRKRRYSTMFTRLDQLQEENKRLKEEVSIAEVEAAKLKKLVIGKLSAST